MSIIRYFLFYIPVLALGVLEVAALSGGMECILDKQRGAGAYFLLWLEVLLFEVLLYSWLPLQFGVAVELLEGLIVLEGGALIANLGWMLAAQALMLGVALIKHLWAAMRKQTRFNGRMVLLELVIIALFTFLAVKLVEVTERNMLLGRSAAMWVVLIGLALLAILQYKKIKNLETVNIQDDKAGEAFSRLLLDYDRLGAAGDYNGQLSLLEQADKLKLSGRNRATVRICRGIAFEKLGNVTAAEASYQAALHEERWNSNALTNLAYLAARKGDFATADQYINTALQHEKDRTAKGHIYASYASICILRGDREKAKRFVETAARMGVGEERLQSLRRTLGI